MTGRHPVTAPWSGTPLRTASSLAWALLAALLPAMLASAGCSNAGPSRIVGGDGSSTHPTATTEPTTQPSSTPAPSPVVSLSRIALTLTPRWKNLVEPLFLTCAPGDATRLFIVEKTGRIRVVKGGRLLGAPFLNISAKVSLGSEQGLLGLAFSPDFMRSGRFYVNYTDTSGNTNVVRYTVDDPDSNAPGVVSVQRVLFVEQPYANHNGGCIVFGPDGFLYVGTGDGGSGGDPQNRAQNPRELLGKMLRLDVEAAGDGQDVPATYRVPADNPFVSAAGRQAGYRPEVWALGLRNPWRFCFDRKTRDLWIGDVGQNDWEEIDHTPAGESGQNFGWNLLEGTHAYPPSSAEPADVSGFTMPVAEYPHPTGESVTGGYVYRGSKYPVLDGVYLYGDYISGRIWGLRLGAKAENRQLAKTQLGISSFGEDSGGELYVCDLRGTVYQVAAKER